MRAAANPSHTRAPLILALPNGRILGEVMPLLRQGRLKPLMDSTFPLEKAADAHRRMEAGEHIGKIVLAV